ncbi:MAG TPA: carboxypeptidase regulatory-like domain-containing protein [Candidatus Limnocylindrales bacterium]|nr:carboxypeptidase regulatory-like domain-containing protein [Candidatus Limnocylindrales bacterium]
MRLLYAMGILIGLSPASMALPPGAGNQGITDSSQVAGFVRDAASGDPLVSARVELISPGGVAAPEQFTNISGEFHFNYVKDGDYKVLVRKMGYEDGQADISVAGGHESHVDIELRARAADSSPSPPPGSPETVSAHELAAPARARDDYAKGKDLMAKANFDEAVEEFRKAIQEFPTFYEAYAKMGVAQYLSGHAAEARGSLQKSIDLSDGKYPDALFDLANILNDVDEFSAAEPLARREILEEPSSWRGHFQLSRALLGLKRYADAEQSAKKAIGLNPKNRLAYVVLTNIHIETHAYPEVLHDIDAYLALDPDSPAAGQMRATRANVVKALSDAQGKQGTLNHPPQ